MGKGFYMKSREIFKHAEKSIWQIFSHSKWQFLLRKLFEGGNYSRVETTDYGRPMRKSPSLHGRKSTPTPKFLGTAGAYFVCHIGTNFQVSLFMPSLDVRSPWTQPMTKPKSKQKTGQ